MEVIEVYANCIQPKDIIRRLKCSPRDTEAIETERNNFLEFLRIMEKAGVFYWNQLDAWSVYARDTIRNSIFEEEPVPTVDFTPLKWEKELEEELENKVMQNQENYSELGGQQ